jgi:hypothetical protein
VISFFARGSSIVVRIESGFNIVASDIELGWDCGNELLARAMLHILRERLGHTMRKVRQEAYDAGWKAAKAKTAKASWQPCHMPKPEEIY